MRRLALALVLATAGAAAAPTANAPVDDEAHVLTAEQQTKLAGELRALHDFDMAVVVVRTTGGVPIATYAHGTAMAWHGGSRPSALLVLALDDRTSRLELDAAMREHVADSRAQRILDGIRPKLQAKDYAGAVEAVVAGVRDAFAEPPAAPAPHDRPPATPIALYVVLGCIALLAGGCLWASIARLRTATVSSDGAHARPFVVDALWCTLKLVGVLVVVCYVLLCIVGPSGGTSSRSTWGATQRRRSSSSGSSDSGSGGATSSW